MRLAALAPPEAQLVGAPGQAPEDVEVTRVDLDSRQVAPGSLFACLPGAHTDGHDHAPAAVAAGAVALLCERPLGLGVAEVRVPDSRRALGPLADRFWGHPSGRLAVAGVTGTNGKTTVVHLLAAIGTAAGRTTATLGTLSGSRTTPEAPDLQEALAGMADRGVELVAMEVSSHALALHRVDGTRFAAVAFTNLTQDHLDFHADLEDYFAAKARLFEPDRAAVGVVDVDDPWGARLAEESAIPVVAAHARTTEVVQATPGTTRFRWRGEEVTLGLGGRFNVANAVVAAELALALGMDRSAVAAGLADVPPVPGRFELIEAGQPFTVVVDYAHTPDGLTRLLQSARAVTGGSVLVVFGCGGDRDPTKRPLMGAAAAALADTVVVTSDNPRSEDPAAIAAAVVAGMDPAADPVVILDRREAMAHALARARDHDVVVIAGKGHETTQDVGGVQTAFDDRQVARQLLAERFGSVGEGAS